MRIEMIMAKMACTAATLLRVRTSLTSCRRCFSVVLDVGDDFTDIPANHSQAKKSSARGKRRPIKFKFVDKVNVRVHGGRGGDGCVSFEVAGPGKKHPSGGHGGAGGDVYVTADEGVESLNFERHHYNASDGSNGGSRSMKGRKGKDVVLRVPLGTVVKEVIDPEAFPEDGPFGGGRRGRYGRSNGSTYSGDPSGGGSSSNGMDPPPRSWQRHARAAGVLASDHGSVGGRSDHAYDQNHGDVGGTGSLRGGGGGGDREQEEEEEEDGVALRVLTDLDMHGASVLVARGGPPGLGNHIMTGSRRRLGAATGDKLPGAAGQEAHLRLELKTIADVGLVGYPNAGKSTLLGAVSRARPKVAPYAFTTLRPMVGHVEYSDTRRLLVADIPGLVDGAHENRGLGHEFLRHVERTAALLYVVDAASTEGRDPVEDLLGLRRELSLYDPALAHKPAMVVANKSDCAEAAAHLPRLRAATPLRVVAVSAERGDGVAEAVVRMRRMVEAAAKMAAAGTAEGAAGAGPATRARSGSMAGVAAAAAAPGAAPAPAAAAGSSLREGSSVLGARNN